MTENITFSFVARNKFNMVREGVSAPAQSGEFIAKNAQHVKIHETGLDKLCEEMLTSITNKLEVPDTGANILQPPKDHERAADWVFVADALNFCFWSYTGAEKWTVDGHSGYYALEAALSRAIKEGIDIANPEYYSKITAEQLCTIMRSDNEVQMPLFDERITVLHEVGTVLLKKYNGTFKNCLKEANKSAVKLLEIVVNDFPCFRDEATFKGQKVALYKRAQILVADIWNFFGGSGWGEFTDIDKMTMFADYRVPQVLVYFGALSYTDELMDKLKIDILLPSGSEEEVEIRGCSIHAVELLKQMIAHKLQGQNVEVPNSSLIDYYLWCYRRKYADDMESIPFHKTLGIYY
ncbi:queuosine 5'-phosphate N-glycosylase/hydrolase [Anticarsia gemmatalis]|uniref:queuosine 5'-phosphate N-glycosylase/hydrolase n=1 Tax=Anticarsia gemmatalis TaxID=129554 RepID=UPI003F76D679